MAAPLISCQTITKTFGLVPVFKDMDFSLGDGDRVAIIGPNGAGKSTLLRILAGQETADTGLITARRGLKTAYVPQMDVFDTGKTIRQILEDSHKAAGHSDAAGPLAEIMGRAGFQNPEALVKELSGGWKKRLAICHALIKEPELLLLDEPTNHLDLEGIEWLEDFLERPGFTFAIITHDRYFMENVCSRIVEINPIYPGGNFMVQGGYGEYLRRKAEFMEGQSAQMARMANKMRIETEWLNRGVEARRTKQQARIKSAMALKDELNSTNNRSRRQAVEFQFSASHRKTKKLIDVVGISKAFGERTLFKDISLTLGPGMRLGLTGPNGSGKSTLLKILQSKLAPDQGTVTTAEQLKVVYYDQHRETLPEGLTLKRALAADSDYVQIRDQKVHVAGYAKSFGFRTEQLDTQVSRLSGGERARLLLGRLLQLPADVLILDEPTNDLDINTLEVLEDNLLEFPGAVILVTHDRYLMDRVSTGILGLDGNGGHGFFADYRQYEIHQRTRDISSGIDGSDKESNNSESKTGFKSLSTAASIVTDQDSSKPKRVGTKKLSYMEQREWDSMETQILEAEETLHLAQAKTQDPGISSSAAKLQEACMAADTAQATVDRLYARWAELEAKLKD
jgi:ATP-binding cassette subfamily F protein uup